MTRFKIAMLLSYLVPINDKDMTVFCFNNIRSMSYIFSFSCTKYIITYNTQLFTYLIM